MMDNKQPTIVSVNLLVDILAGIAVILRVLARRVRNLPLKSDDMTIIAALPFSWSICACNIVASTYGLGRHIETLSSADIIHEAQSLPPKFFGQWPYRSSGYLSPPLEYNGYLRCVPTVPATEIYLE
ncbi:hypothetical protein BDZ45DRAFT_749575 [Acephala macrosclerotiorum]|nr:hypothetical protein BDZ45DRAFT_749575 [Acephala macrosclerotiorum]